MLTIIDIILSVIFSALIVLHLSWISILVYPKKEEILLEKAAPSISIVIPAHNEEETIGKAVKSVLDADYQGKREVIVVNDGSSDRTEEIVKKLATKDERIRIHNTDHVGKSKAINSGVEKAANEIIITLDADSEIDKAGLTEMAKPFSDEEMGAVSGIVRAEYNLNPLTWFQDFEYIQSSAWRFICNKVNATYIFPGFAAFRKDVFLKVGGFSNDTCSEDFEIGLRLRKAGCKVGMSRATMYTRVPETIRGLIKQRTRWGRGTVQVMRKHRDMILNWRYGVVGLYGIPTQIYWYIHGFVYIPILAYQVSEGYYKYFLSNNVYFSLDVVKYFIGWFSVYGTIEYTYKTFQGYYEMTIVFVLLVIMFTLYLIYNILVLYKFAHPKKRHFFVIFFFFPYSLLSLTLHITPSITEIFKPTGSNIWEKSK